MKEKIINVEVEISDFMLLEILISLKHCYNISDKYLCKVEELISLVENDMYSNVVLDNINSQNLILQFNGEIKE